MIRTMSRIRVLPDHPDAVPAAWRAAAADLAAVPGLLHRELLLDALDARAFVVVLEWVDESALRAYRAGPVAARIADALRPFCEPTGPDDHRTMHGSSGWLRPGEPVAAPPVPAGPGATPPVPAAAPPAAASAAPGDDPTGTTIFVDVEIVVPPQRRAEFHRGYPEVAARMARVPGYLREDLLREPGSDIHHIFAEWTGEAAFFGWIADPAHAREEAGPIAPFLLDFRRRILHRIDEHTDHRRDRWRAGGPSRRGKETDVHTTTDVLIVGAGPTGLTAAVELARRGIDCRVIDRLTAPPGQADKAIGVHCRTMEIWEEQGIVREAMDAGIWLTGNMVFVNGAEVHRMSWELPDLPYAHLGLPQYETERILTDRLATLGGAVRRGTELVSFTQDDAGVTATVRTADGGTAQIGAKYLVGCDGAHSRVREQLGLTFSGGLGRFPQLFMLGDVDVDWDMPAGHLLRFMHETDGQMDGMLVCVPLRGESRYRIATLAPARFFAQTGGQDAPPGFSEELGSPTLADVQAAIDQLGPAGTRASNLRWSSVFRISHGIVDRYRGGRVFVAGDAAHLHPPAGGQGMNTGIQDAWNLAWKLALAVRGLAAPGLLDSYETERRPEGVEIVGRAVRMAFTDELDRADLVRQFRREMSMLLSYANSPLVGESLAAPEALADGPGPGDRAPDAGGLRRPGVGHPLRLRDLTRGTRHTLLSYADGDTDEATLGALAQLYAQLGRQTGGEVDGYLLLGPDAPVPASPAPPVVHDADGEFRRAYGVAGAALYLIRPDGHVGFRSQPIDADALRKHVNLVFGGSR
ncbi:FAD-dependent monooxygenase [Plantactinospora sp. KBS50]|uniref:FAD-dependent monooxygenase n=1 Tax=Plantactinospora sp. KBS50 TaxID=2024580 RepID=UPI000BAAB96F|nr:FAD-dependent monooxygenase [Plantactinospora sp. KBS50]ASW52948.1 monooxygenase [Plantactinospora sp. KBS50]